MPDAVYDDEVDWRDQLGVGVPRYAVFQSMFSSDDGDESDGVSEADVELLI